MKIRICKYIKLNVRNKIIKHISLIVIPVLVIALTGCGTGKDTSNRKTVKVALDSNNFKEYVILNVQLENYQMETTTGLFTTYEYRGSATLRATASLKKDVKVEDVVIKGKIMTTGMCWSLLEYGFELTLDKDGRAEYSSIINTGNYGLTAPQAPQISKYYNELKDNEFFADDNQTIVITSVTGSVSEMK